MGRHLVVTPDPAGEQAAREVVARSPGRADAVVCCCLEDFTVGPVPGTCAPEALLRHRHRHWWQGIQGNAPLPASSATRLMSRADTVEIWIGGTAREQLCLLAPVAATAWQGKGAAQLTFRQFETPLPWDALEVMRHTRLRDAPAPTHCSPDAFDCMLRMWRAVCAPEPGDLVALCRERKPVSGLPWLHRGPSALRDCYPDQISGLDSTDRLLLEEAGTDCTNAARIVASVMTGRRGGQLSGDMILFRRLREMAAPGLSDPALLFRGPSENPGAGEYRLTTAGADFLAGRRNAVSVNGMDRWIGGVHIDSRAGNLWLRRADGTISRG